MRSRPHIPAPAKTALHRLGRNINIARRRRRITTHLLAERAGISRVTLSKIEKGDPSTSMGAYASVLFVLGMVDTLTTITDSAHDLVGLELADEDLPKRIHIARQKADKTDEADHE